MKTAVVICPGRGTYNVAELGYLSRHFPDPVLLEQFEQLRTAAGQEHLSELDGAEKFSMSRHGRGDNASALIYTATLGDFLSIDRKAIEVVAVTGNSMGWYSALACAGVLSGQDGFSIANTMGRFMQESLIGGQLIHPWIDEDWRRRPEQKANLLSLIASIGERPEHFLRLSIDLGGFLVIAGNEAGLKAFEASVKPAQGRFPMRLTNHAAFHTSLQEAVAARGRATLGHTLFGYPRTPLIDGRGHVWWPHGTSIEALHDYTLGHQVTAAYDFTRAIAVAAREFAPDYFVVTGPGTTLGGAVAQSLILANWRGLDSKDAFQSLQASSPILISMGMPEQRSIVTA